MNRIGKLLLNLILILFISLFLTKYTTEYNENKKLLTEKAILEYESDLKEGKDILSKNYVPDEKNYNNKAAKIGRGISNIIEKTFDKGFEYLMKYLSHLQD